MPILTPPYTLGQFDSHQYSVALPPIRVRSQDFRPGPLTVCSGGKAGHLERRRRRLPPRRVPVRDPGIRHPPLDGRFGRPVGRWSTLPGRGHRHEDPEPLASSARAAGARSPARAPTNLWKTQGAALRVDGLPAPSSWDYRYSIKRNQSRTVSRSRTTSSAARGQQCAMGPRSVLRLAMMRVKAFWLLNVPPKLSQFLRTI
jgi:hypothetical protein